jgi:hypothetical protein
MDMPLLPVEKRVPSSLQGYLKHKLASGTLAEIHNDRVYAFKTSTNPAYLLVCRRYMLG